MTAMQKIVWAVDPLRGGEQFRLQAAQFLELLSRKSSLSIQPVYVVSSQPSGPVSEATGPWLVDPLREAQQALHEAMAGVRLPGLLSPEVINGRMASTAQAAQLLSDYAYEQGADAILVCTHGRRGMARLLLGSFTETLIDQSRVPALVLGPRHQLTQDLRRVFFPTDFGPYAQESFRTVVSLARQLGAGLVLFHLIPRPVEPILQSGAYLLGGSWVPVQAYFSDVTPRNSRHAELWARWARAQGVETEVLIDSMTDNISDTIVRLVQEKGAELTVIEHKHGPIASTLLGSIARQVIRSASCPVWLLRPEQVSRRRLVTGSDARRAARRAA